MARRYDPDRRQRLIEAAIRVVGEHGIDGLTHRRVAAEADVPLGSTTYHFASRDDLLHAALRQTGKEWLAGAELWERSIDPGVPFVDELVRLLQESLSGDRRRARLEYELYLAALRHHALRPQAAECLDGLATLLRRRTPDDATARALAALLDGLMLQFLLTDREAGSQEIRGMLTGILGAAQVVTPGR
ncbi:TetR family transcriptional regulator [Streptomyces sp. N2-109]|uniref:TetR family transcriptional regulator n=1 Tax=Streptomyces gossypii TaxID=2883101 RepID=A0ABT2K0Y3_9ACTN|nr:TetR family transcriptional regulator [Streptomyces gossypii]MCT2593826.1 TetR family transcriptional regulator [Streptomyces gossypii]